VADLDESALSEITILPDGRVYAFGITQQVADLLRSLQSREDALRRQAAAAGLAVPQHQETH
jgi:hypothetical protein